MTAGIIRVGTSGWTFAPWRGVFYPKDLRRERELEYTARQFRAVEINSTFYGTQQPETFAIWAEQVPAHFVFAVKGPRLITHIHRLKQAEVPLADFLASGLLRLGLHLGPILWQLPPNLRFAPDQMEPFLRLLPRDTEQAAVLAQKHEKVLRKGVRWGGSPNATIKRPFYHAIQTRNESFRARDCVDLMRRYGVALVCTDAAGWPRFMDVTADFVYCRLHGSSAIADGGYDNQGLDGWAQRLKAWAEGDEPPDAERVGGRAPRRKRDVFAFFDDGLRLRAPANALELIRRLRS